ncbi:hypothetical protein G7Y89_g5882 [Cudoniella acicularis]|uniref:NACHT domain-containing protein n=1 Tax=Cudoniella acicularis TaxID=354080 RepID=A0A8H4RN15_9HELO|nr:hypothetical protein G7Y89_g5882 [Cudoniella acicularis]
MSLPTFNHNDYTIGWICALPSPEYAAALFMLDEEHPRLPRTHADTNNYTLGQIGQHNVVIACLPQGEYGLSSATNVASQMRHSFPNIQFGLMVGIAGGVPKLPDHDIRLGDVVVSKPGMGNGGVIQYDYGKALEGDVFETTGWLDAPPTIVRTAISTLQARQIRWGNEFLRFLESFEGNEMFRCPGPENDLLYEAGDVEMLVVRPERKQSVVVHYGTIASGNALIKDGKRRDKLREKHDILCFEMEAAGLMNSFPCAVIRGICDYADSHKNKQWQAYAAATAAAYAKCLLGHIDPIKVGAPMGQDQKLLMEKDRRKMISWLSPLNFVQTQEDILGRWQQGTGAWLLEDKKFRKWVDKEENLLWCTGIPGSGKSVLASVIVNHLSKTKKQLGVGVAVVFCSYEDRTQQTAVNLLASIVQQLIPTEGVMSQDLQRLHKRHQDLGTRPSIVDILSVLRAQIKVYKRTYIIIDGLDECYHDDGCGEIFLEEVLKLLPGIRLLITSRPLLTLQFELESAARLEILAKESDIRAHLDTRLDKNRRIATFIRKYPTLKSEIIDAVAGKAQGMFLLARLHIDALATKHSVKEIRDALQKLPRGLSDTYDQALQRILDQNEDDADFSRKVLAWVTYAVRPLTMAELKHALAISPDDTEFCEESCPEDEFILSLCAGLVAHEPRSGAIRLVHYTAQEHLQKSLLIRFPDVHSEIAVSCLTYISLEELSSGFCKTFADERSRIQKLTLLDYACKNWGTHARQASISTYKNLALQVLRDDLKLSSIVQAMSFHGQASTTDPGQFFNSINGIHIAAHFGLLDLMNEFIQSGSSVDLQDSVGQTALHRATRSGHFEATKALVEKGATVEISDLIKRTALHEAASKGYYELAQLLASKTTIETKDHVGLTPLQLSTEAGNNSICRLLLERGADISVQCLKGQTPLHRAAIQGYESIITLLLDSDADTEARDKEGKTPLISAASQGRTEACRVLLQRGANVQVCTNAKRTALHEAARGGHETVLKLLIKSGAKLESQDGRRRTALHEAADATTSNIALRSVKVLLESGADSVARDQGGSTALIIASQKGRRGVVQSILDHSLASLHVRGYQGTSPLISAAARGRKEVVTILLQQDHLLISGKDDKGRTALHHAALYGSVSTAKVLLRAQADIESRDNDGATPLHISIDEDSDAEEGMIDNIEFILKKGSNIDCRTLDGLTPLHLAAHANEVESIKVLGENGADVHATNKGHFRPIDLAISPIGTESSVEALRALLELGSGTETAPEGADPPLFAAAIQGKLDLVKVLINAGADVNHKNIFGVTPLMCTKGPRNNQIFETLLKHGADVFHVGLDGGTLLHGAAQGGADSFVQFLVDAGLDVNSQDSIGRTPLDRAQETQRHTTVKLLQTLGSRSSRETNTLCPSKSSAPPSRSPSPVPQIKAGIEDSINVMAIQNAIREGDINRARELLSEEKELAKLPLLLNLAVLRGSAKLVQLLLDSGSDPNKFTKFGSPPLWAAFSSNFVDLAKLLVQHGADLSYKPNGVTYLHLAAQRDHEESTTYLLAQGSDIEAKAESGTTTPLLVAAAAGACRTLRLLIDAKASLETPDEHQRTPLYSAMMKDKLDIIHILLASGANVEAVTDIGLTTLQGAARLGHTAIVSALLEHGAQITQAQEDGFTALHEAAEAGHLEAARVLLDAGADMEAESTRGFTALHKSIYRGFDEITSLLLDQGANIHCSSRNDETPLHTAAKKGNLAVVTRLLEMGAEIDVHGPSRNTALMMAADEEHHGVVRALLMRHAKATLTGSGGLTAFHMACRNGSLDTIRLMLHLGLSPNTKSSSGVTPLHTAAEYDHRDIAELLIDHRAEIDSRATQDTTGDTPLHCAAEWNARKVAELLISKGADIHAQNVRGTTPIHYAAEYEAPLVLEYLLENGTEINIQNKKCETPLHRAAIYGCMKVTEHLLKKGADVEAKTQRGSTALMLAAEYGKVKTLKLLLESKSSILARNKKQETALHLAASYGEMSVITILIEAGAEIESRDLLGCTPLLMAAEGGYFSVVKKLLIKHHADLQAVDDQGRNTLHLAADGGHTGTSKLLIKKGVDSSCCDKYGRNALHHAAASGVLKMVERILDTGNSKELNVADVDGWMPLHWATRKGNLATIKRLLEEKNSTSPLTWETDDGWTPSSLAAYYGCDKKVKVAFEPYKKLSSSRPEGEPAVGAKAKRDCDGCEMCARSLLKVHPQHEFVKWSPGEKVREGVEESDDA